MINSIKIFIKHTNTQEIIHNWHELNGKLVHYETWSMIQPVLNL